MGACKIIFCLLNGIYLVLKERQLKYLSISAKFLDFHVNFSQVRVQRRPMGRLYKKIRHFSLFGRDSSHVSTTKLLLKNDLPLVFVAVLGAISNLFNEKTKIHLLLYPTLMVTLPPDGDHVCFTVDSWDFCNYAVIFTGVFSCGFIDFCTNLMEIQHIGHRWEVGRRPNNAYIPNIGEQLMSGRLPITLVALAGGH